MVWQGIGNDKCTPVLRLLLISMFAIFSFIYYCSSLSFYLFMFLIVFFALCYIVFHLTACVVVYFFSPYFLFTNFAGLKSSAFVSKDIPKNSVCDAVTEEDSDSLSHELHAELICII